MNGSFDFIDADEPLASYARFQTGEGATKSCRMLGQGCGEAPKTGNPTLIHELFCALGHAGLSHHISAQTASDDVETFSLTLLLGLNCAIKVK